MNSLTCLLGTLLLFGGALGAQAPSSSPSAKDVATSVAKGRLSLAHLRRLRCASPSFANCAGGIQVVQNVVFLRETMRGDTVWFPVRWQILGYVASSEASLMFLPDRDTYVDSGIVTVIRRGAHWMVDTSLVMSQRPQTSVAAARQFFRFDAEDRRALDSVVKARRTFRPPAPNEQ